jgi:DNA mismatch repair ATPase MutS
VPLAAQVVLLTQTTKLAHRAFDLASARQGTVDAFEHMLRLVETSKFEAPLLREIHARVCTQGTLPSAHLQRLRSWTSCAELRKQFLLYIFVNPLTLWDLHVLRGLERWNRDVGKTTTDWFVALGELEALSSLATLAYGDPDAIMPAIEDAPFEARGLCHPLLAAHKRVANDVVLAGSGSALLITGSNMAGKSTLLRALGVNVALALAGGPVCAAAMSVPVVRLRASMRADDSLEEGASYFHAELLKLRRVVDDADAEPPVLFLLDELLRGTNARARHVGARAVLLHLLKRRALGLCATHDIALSELEQEQPERIHNVHFTDVIENGEMRFDYRLRPGVVRTSNALRLLAMAGIDVAADDVALGDLSLPNARGVERT